MGYLVPDRWITEPASGLPRADRQSCTYEAYVPDKLFDGAFQMDGDVAADITDAEAAIRRLDTEAAALTDTEAVARLLLRAESVASSRIEGLEIGPRRLLRAEAALAIDSSASDVSSDEILGNIEAMRVALDAAQDDEPITVDTFVEIHRRLLENTRLRDHAGQIRTTQNWIGGSSYNPCCAAFIPPPPALVHGLLEDLAAFCNSDMLPAVAQAAIAHAQFETIHPFADGNGRTGRALIHLILRRRGLSQRVQPPISLILATRADGYVNGLAGYRYVGTLNDPDAHRGVNAWIGFFSAACVRAVEDAESFEATCQRIESEWRDRVGKVRKGSSVDRLLSALPGTPIVSVNSAMALLGVSKVQANGAIARLVQAGVLKQVTVGRRNRAFEARTVIDAFTDLERRLASPLGDTIAAPPVRPVPARRN
jgi:Fic family protein